MEHTSETTAEVTEPQIPPVSREVGVALVPKHPLAIRWFHWINFPVLFTMIWSGLLIYWANDVYRIGYGNVTLLKFFPAWFYDRFSIGQRLAEGMAYHFFFMWIFAINGLLYVIYLGISKEWRYLLPNRSTLKEAIHVVLHDLRLRRDPLPRAKFNGAQRIAYTGVVLMGLGSLLTGLAIYKPVQLALLSTPFSGLAGATGYQVARWIHFWLTMGFCGFFLVHVLQVIRAGWNNFRAMITGYELEPVEVPTPTVEENASDAA
jgi:thiosulfate reductase cytochrome b subunit